MQNVYRRDVIICYMSCLIQLDNFCMGSAWYKMSPFKGEMYPYL